MSTYSSPERYFMEALRTHLPSALPDFLLQQRWFGGKARAVQSVDIPDIVPLDTTSFLILARVHYASGPAETYAIPLVRASGEIPLLRLRIQPDNFTEEIFLKDALLDERFLTQLLEAIARNVSLAGNAGQIRAISTSAQQPLKPSLMHAEQSNSSVVYQQRMVLKLFRRLEEGLNPVL